MKSAKTELSEDEYKHYSNLLAALWESYIRYLHVGMAASGFTIVLVANFLKDTTELEPSLGVTAKLSITLAGFAGLCYGVCRWLCQILMERQVYGKADKAAKYFEVTDTRKPNALRYSIIFLTRAYQLNDILKYAGSVSLMVSWAIIVYFLWQKVDLLAIAPQK